MASVALGSTLTLLRANQNDAAPHKPLIFTPNWNSLRFNHSLRTHASSTRCCSVGAPRAAAEAVEDVIVKEKEKGRVLRVGVVCGGPSAERGISLNSARSVIDHIQVKLLLLLLSLSLSYSSYCLLANWEIEMWVWIEMCVWIFVFWIRERIYMCVATTLTRSSMRLRYRLLRLVCVAFVCSKLAGIVSLSLYKVCALTGVLQHSGGFWIRNLLFCCKDVCLAG